MIFFKLGYGLTCRCRSAGSSVSDPMREAELSDGEESIIVVPDILCGNDYWRRTKILIVDTELPNVQFLERILRRVRIENLMSTTDSRAALSLFQEFRPDLVLIDWFMAQV